MKFTYAGSNIYLPYGSNRDTQHIYMNNSRQEAFTSVAMHRNMRNVEKSVSLHCR